MVLNIALCAVVAGLVVFVWHLTLRVAELEQTTVPKSIYSDLVTRFFAVEKEVKTLVGKS